MHIRKIVRTGNGLSICVPKELARYLHIERADYIVIQLVDEKSFLVSTIDPDKIPELTGLPVDDLPVIKDQHGTLPHNQ